MMLLLRRFCKWKQGKKITWLPAISFLRVEVNAITLLLYKCILWEMLWSGVESIGKNYAFVIWEELIWWFQTQVFSRYGFVKNCLGQKYVDSFQANWANWVWSRPGTSQQEEKLKFFWACPDTPLLQLILCVSHASCNVVWRWCWGIQSNFSSKNESSGLAVLGRSAS